MNHIQVSDHTSGHIISSSHGAGKTWGLRALMNECNIPKIYWAADSHVLTQRSRCRTYWLLLNIMDQSLPTHLGKKNRAGMGKEKQRWLWWWEGTVGTTVLIFHLMAKWIAARVKEDGLGSERVKGDVLSWDVAGDAAWLASILVFNLCLRGFMNNHARPSVRFTNTPQRKTGRRMFPYPHFSELGLLQRWVCLCLPPGMLYSGVGGRSPLLFANKLCLFQLLPWLSLRLKSAAAPLCCIIHQCERLNTFFRAKIMLLEALESARGESPPPGARNPEALVQNLPLEVV